MVAKRKQKPPAPQRPKLYISTILAWADAHHRRTGRWPKRTDGEVRGAPAEKWSAIDRALQQGSRGCRGGDSLPKFLFRHRGVRNRKALPHLTIKKILAWADAHHRRTGRWPTYAHNDPVVDAPGESWSGVDGALHQASRGLPGGDSLAKVLLRHRQVRRTIYRPPLTIEQILAWADAHHRRTGRWPHFKAGHIVGTRDETWMAMHEALRTGKRGLRRGYTVATLLEKHRGRPHLGHRRRFTEREILRWADAYHVRTGRWPDEKSGPIPESPGDTWRVVARALRKGYRGLPGRVSLFQVLARNGRIDSDNWRMRRTRRRPTLSIKLILSWADAHHRRTGQWPRAKSGPVVGAPDERWVEINNALTRGRRGLKKTWTLATLLEEHCGARHQGHLAALTPRKILAWADAYHRRTGNWPQLKSGPIPEAPGETWRIVESALSNGVRGLPGHDTLFRFLLRHNRLPASDWRRKRLRTLAAQGITAWAPPPGGGRTGRPGWRGTRRPSGEPSRAG